MNMDIINNAIEKHAVRFAGFIPSNESEVYDVYFSSLSKPLRMDFIRAGINVDKVHRYSIKKDGRNGDVIYNGISNPLVEAIDEYHFHKETDEIELLLQKGADVNAEFMRDGMRIPTSPLSAAIFHGDAEVVDILVEHGAFVKAGALFASLYSPALLKKLVDLGADVDFSFGSSTPLENTVRMLNSVKDEEEKKVLTENAKCLISNGAAITKVCKLYISHNEEIASIVENAR